MNNAVMVIMFNDATSAAENETVLESRIEKAMNATRDHFLASNDDEQFRAAVGAVLLLTEGKDKERIMLELDYIKTATAALSGVKTDFGSLPELTNPVGLVNMWNKVKGKS